MHGSKFMEKLQIASTSRKVMHERRQLDKLSFFFTDVTVSNFPMINCNDY